MSKLTKKQQLFVDEFLKDLNATQAAIRAGYSTKRADAIGSENLRKPVIAAAIQAALDERSKRCQIDADQVLQRLIEIKHMSIRDILNDDWTLKPLNEWPDVWCESLAGLDVKELRTGQSDTEAVTAVLTKLKWPDKIRAIELIGKHVDCQAFKERSEHHHDVIYTQIIREIIDPQEQDKSEGQVRTQVRTGNT